MPLKAKKNSTTSETMKKTLSDLQKEEMQKLNIHVPKSKLKPFKIKAIQNDTTMTEVILKFINEYISK